MIITFCCHICFLAAIEALSVTLSVFLSVWVLVNSAVMQPKGINFNSANKSCQLLWSRMQTNVVICNLCIQKLSQLWRNFAIFSFCLEFYRFKISCCFLCFLSILLSIVFPRWNTISTALRIEKPAKSPNVPPIVDNCVSKLVLMS